LSLPGFVLKIATQDSHPPSHISFASNHNRATTTDGQDPRPFTSFTSIRNPLNKEEVIESRLWPDHCIQGTKGEELVHDIQWSHLTRLDDKRWAELEQPAHSYAALSSSKLAILKKGLVPSLEQYSAFTPPFINPPIHPPPKKHTSGSARQAEDGGRSPPLLTRLLQAFDVTHVYVVGLVLDYCVKGTALDAVRQGFHTYVVEEGTRAVDASIENVNKVKAELRAGGVEVLEGPLGSIDEINWVKLTHVNIGSS
jgi:nicotinamidase-related amidase